MTETDPTGSGSDFDAPAGPGSEDFTHLQEEVGDGADEQPGADGAALDEDYNDPDDDASDDDAEGEGVGAEEAEGDEPA